MSESRVPIPEIPADYYNFHHTYTNTVAVPKNVALWNILDFSHVNWVHKRNYAYCKVLAQTNRITFLEYGVRLFFFLRLPFKSPVLMWHEFVPPHVVRHLSRSAWGAYTKTAMTLEEFQQDGQTHTRIVHEYHGRLPFFLLPFKRIFSWYLDAWSKILWAEDAGILLRRQRVLQAGFTDHPVDVTPRAAEGLPA